MKRCSGIKPNGGRCERIVSTEQEYCYSHDPERAAEQRGLGDLVARYFDEVDPEARDLYNEWLEAPSPQVLERQIEGVETIVHRPSVDELMPQPGIPA